MKKWIRKYPRVFAGLAGVLGVILAVWYLSLVLQKGFWYDDTFLCRQQDGYYFGSDSYGGHYGMTIDKTAAGGTVSFTIGANTRQYRIDQQPGDDQVLIYKDGEEIFKGTVTFSDGRYYLKQSAQMDEVGNNGSVLGEDLFPGYSRVYNWLMAKNLEIRGNLLMPVLAAFIGLLLFLDVRFPDLFFHLHYGLAVAGGEPSEFYRTSQSLRRMVAAVSIVVLLIMGIVIH